MVTYFLISSCRSFGIIAINLAQFLAFPFISQAAQTMGQSSWNVFTSSAVLPSQNDLAGKMSSNTTKATDILQMNMHKRFC